MACNCGKGKSRQTYQVKLPGGLKISKNSESEARAYAAKHPGSTVIKSS